MPLREDERDLADVGDVLCRVAVEQHEISELAGHDPAAILACAGVPGAVARRELNRLRWRQAGLDVQRATAA